MISANVPVKNSAETKLNLLNLDRAGLESFFDSIGEKKFRASQVLKWMHQLGVSDFSLMSNVSKVLQEKLQDSLK